MSGQYCSGLNNSRAEGTAHFSGGSNSPVAPRRSTGQATSEPGQTSVRQLDSGTDKVTPWDRANWLCRSQLN